MREAAFAVIRQDNEAVFWKQCRKRIQIGKQHIPLGRALKIGADYLLLSSDDSNLHCCRK